MTARLLKLNRAGLAREVKNQKPWFRIRNADQAGGPTKVYLYGTIGESWWGDGNTAADFNKALNEITADEIQLHINSGGGDVYEGLAILNGLRQHSARIVVTIDGLAASAASFIAMAGDEVVMARNSEMMIHDAWGFAMGNAADFTRYAADLERISSNIAEVYADRTDDGDAAAFRKLMLAETWFSAQEAVDAGLADRVEAKDDGSDSGDSSASAKADALTRSVLAFAHAGGRADAPAPALAVIGRRPTNPSAAPAAAATPPASASAGAGDTHPEGASLVGDITDEQMTTLRQTAGVADDADLDTCLAAIAEALDERAEDPAANRAQTGAAAAIPEGMVLMDASQQQQLLDDAQAGRQARNQQQTERREGLVNAAVADGRIPPARRAHWLASLAADPGTEETLASLAPGLVPMDERGHASHADGTHADDDDRLMAQAGWASPTAGRKED